MRLEYATALLQYCSDLTDPDAENVPVACFLVARGDDSYYAAAAGFHANFVNSVLGEVDELSESMLGDLPQLIKSHVNEVFSDQSDAPRLEQILFDLESALRNTLNVSGISRIQSIEVERQALEGLGGELSEIVTHRLLEAVRSHLGVQVSTPRPSGGIAAIRSMFGTQQAEDETDAGLELPSQTFWPVHSPQSAQAVR